MNNQHTSTTWTNARLNRLTMLWKNTDLSARKIGNDLGVTRNSIIGKLHRLGLSMKDRPDHAHETLRQARSGGGRKSLGRPNGGRPLKALFVAKPECLPVTQPSQLVSQNENRLPDLPPSQKPLLDLATGECRWPSGEGTIAEPFAFCAAQQVDGSSYCEAHREEAHRPYASEYRKIA